MVQATGRVRNYQITYGLTKLTAVPIVYVLYKIGTPIEYYLYVLILLSWTGLAIQLVIVGRLIKEFSKKEFFNKVIARELLSYILPFCFAFVCMGRSFSISEAIVVCLIAETLCLTSSAFIGMNANERSKIKSVIINQIHKRK